MARPDMGGGKAAFGRGEGRDPATGPSRHLDPARRLQPRRLRDGERPIEDAAILLIDGVARSVPLLALADYWRGEFATFWRVPPEYSGAIVDRRSGPTANWLARQLAVARADSRPIGEQFDDAALKGWIHTFQLTQGLPSDGVAGPVTLMQLNRAVGVDEPRLQAEN